MRRLVMLILMMTAPAAAAGAQTELEVARSTLHGIGAFGVAVDVETAAGLAGHEALDVRAFRAAVEERLETAGLPLLDAYDGLTQPHLYVHVNAADAGSGLVPFSIEVDFRQPVYLDPGRSVATAATTWDDSVVGLVSHDRMALIGEALLALVDQFAEDFRQINF